MTVDVIAGRFALCDPIGSGGSGTVWRAFDRKLNRYCAAKLLRQRDAGDLLRFVREQSVRLDHPNIVSPYSWVAEDGTVLIASDLMTGGSVHTLIGDYGPLADATVTTIVRQVLAGLHAVHDAELIHRDVKPANLLLQATGTGPLHVVLTDFGLTISRLDARLTQVGMVIGTPGYVPPEVLKGGVPPDPRHDLFAVGRLALTLITGSERVGRMTSPIDSIQDVSLRRTVEALLRDDPEERPVDVLAAAALLTEGQPDQAPRTRDDDPIDVLDQLPELPPGWGPNGPLEAAAPSRVGPRATIVDVAPTAPVHASGPSVEWARPVVPPAELPRTVVPQPMSRTSPIAPTDRPLPSDQPPPRRWGPVWAVSALVAVVIAGIVVALWLLPDSTTNDPSDTNPTTGTIPTAVSTPATSAPATSTPTTSPGSVSTRQTPASATLAPENIRAGDGCTWQQEGDRRTGVEGVTLVCTLADGTYQWREPG